MTTMRALVLKSYRPDAFDVSLETIPIPQPQANEALVRISASPINPSDLSFMQGFYGIRRPLPTVPGFEASGEIIAVGDVAQKEHWVGKRVACFAGESNGTWAEYMVTRLTNCLPIPDTVTDEMAATALVNPLTAWALLDIASESGSPSIVQTAAASALGQMIIRRAQCIGLKTVNIVRRQEQVNLLKTLGGDVVLNSETADFKDALREACQQFSPTLAYDAIGGVMTDWLLRALPRGSRVIVYGGLAGEPCRVGVDQLIFRNQRVEGFWLTYWMRDYGARLPQAWGDVMAGISTDYHGDIRARYGLADWEAALADYTSAMTGGKVLFIP